MGGGVLSRIVNRLVLYEPSLGLRYPAGSIEAVEEAVAAGNMEADWVYRPGQFDSIAVPTLLLAGSETLVLRSAAERFSSSVVPAGRGERRPALELEVEVGPGARLRLRTAGASIAQPGFGPSAVSVESWPQRRAVAR